jgi:hypothetical protein
MDHTIILTKDSAEAEAEAEGEADILPVASCKFSEHPDGALVEDVLTDSEVVNLKDLGAEGLTEDGVHTKSKHESACVRIISDTK